MVVLFDKELLSINTSYHASNKDQIMASWKEFTEQAPELAQFGKSRLDGKVAYLGTLRPDGGPRVHPVTPIIGEQLFLFMEPTSPKGKDLQRDPRYALHCSVEDSSGGEGEFYIRGQAALTDDSGLREQAIRASSYAPADRYILFVFTIEFAFMNIYVGGNPNPRRWQADE
jgi:Pyridoxamine 5'-phosphate oxidase